MYADAVYGSTDWIAIAVIVFLGALYTKGFNYAIKIVAYWCGFWIVWEQVLPRMGSFGKAIAILFVVYLVYSFIKGK